MSKLTILKESTPYRCEICHQSDYFDPKTNSCSRCGDVKNLPALKTNTKLSNVLAAINSPNRQIVIPSAVSLEELGHSFTIVYKWFSTKRLGFIFLLMSTAFPSFITAFTRSGFNGSFSNWIFLFIFPIYFLLILSVILNKTYITISDNQICKISKPINIIPKKVINIDDISDFAYERIGNEDRLNLILKSGKRIRLIGNMDDKESMLFVESVLKERLSKKR
jgi:hypothetical protein